MLLIQCSVLCRKVASLSHEKRQDIYWLSPSLPDGAISQSSSYTSVTSMWLPWSYLPLGCKKASTGSWYSWYGRDNQQKVIWDIPDKSGFKHPSNDWEMSWSSKKSSIYLLGGKISDTLDNHALATYSYKDVLKLHAYCFEAFNLLMSCHILTAQKENELPESLPLSMLCTEEQEWLCFLFENKF